MPNLDAWSPRVLSILRIVAGLLFLEHGLMKAIAFPGPQMGVPHPLPPLLVAAAAIEIVGGGLIALGLFTRIAAFVASGEMAAAYFLGHFPRSVWPGLNMGGEAILYCFLFFYFVFAGGGLWSLDAALRKRP